MLKDLANYYLVKKADNPYVNKRLNRDKAQKSELLTDLSNYYLAKKMSFA